MVKKLSPIISKQHIHINNHKSLKPKNSEAPTSGTPSQNCPTIPKEIGEHFNTPTTRETYPALKPVK